MANSNNLSYDAQQYINCYKAQQYALRHDNIEDAEYYENLMTQYWNGLELEEREKVTDLI